MNYAANVLFVHTGRTRPDYAADVRRTAGLSTPPAHYAQAVLAVARAVL